VQDLQGKAERVKPIDILQRLLDAYVEKAALRNRHEAVARIVDQYDANNTYQYVIAREDQHLAWLADAVASLGGTVPEQAPHEAVAAVKGEAEVRRIVGEDAQALDAFVSAWRPRAAAVTNARHRLMLELTLGEMQEHARLFHQASAGRLDLLGRRTGGARTVGSVMPTRWVE
jgi:uncharacterized protein YhbP (UPF0306 family)